MVLCHHGKRWHPPEMRVGETREFSGSLWAFIREQDTVIGRASLFKIHEERPTPTLAHSPNGPVAALISHLPSGWDEKGRPTTANAGALFTLLQQSGFADRFRFNLLTLEVEIDGVELNPTQARPHVPFRAAGTTSLSQDPGRHSRHCRAEQFSSCSTTSIPSSEFRPLTSHAWHHAISVLPS